MKLTLLVLSSLLLLACEGKVSSSKKTCTYNGASVDCNAQTQSARPSSTRTNLELSAKVSAKSHINGNTLEVLENTEVADRQTADGKDFECIAGTDAGNYRFEIVNNVLKITQNGTVVSYEFKYSYGKSPMGVWINTVTDNHSKVVTQLSIWEDSIDIHTNCKYF